MRRQRLTDLVRCQRRRWTRRSTRTYDGVPVRGGGVPSTAPLLALCQCWIAAALFVAGNGALAEPPESHGDAPRVLAEFSIDKGGAPVVVRVLVKGKEYRMLIDTGAGVSGFDTAHRGALGRRMRKLRIDTLTGPLTVEMFRPPAFEIGGMRLRPRNHVGCADTPFTDASGRRVDGVLGMDVLKRLVISLDFDAGTMRFWSRADDSFGRRVPLIRDHGDPNCRMVRASLSADMTEKFLIDTGYTSGDSGGLAAETFDLLRQRRELLPVAPVIGDGARKLISAGGRSVNLQLGRLPRMSLAGFAHGKPVFCRQTHPSTLGLAYLSRYQVAFDFPNNILYLREGKQFERSDVYDLSGMNVELDGDMLRVGYVGPRSLAATAGVESGDVVLAVDGRQVRQTTVFEVRRRFCLAGPHDVEIERGGERRTIALTLREGDQPDADETGGAESE